MCTARPARSLALWRPRSPSYHITLSRPAPQASPAASSSPSRTTALRSCHAGAHLSKERKAELEKVAEAIAQRGKGITACDEGPGTIGDRFAKYGIANSEEARPRGGGRRATSCRAGGLNAAKSRNPGPAGAAELPADAVRGARG